MKRNSWRDLATSITLRTPGGVGPACPSPWQFYENESDLQEALFYAWSNLDIAHIWNLTNSIIGREKDCSDK